MAQLRDARTGELVFEGSPLECVVHAGELGPAAVSDQSPTAPASAELVYDDVGLGFDPDAVLADARANVEALVEAAEEDASFAESAAAAKAALEPDRDRLAAASSALEEARARQDAAG